MTFDLNTLLLTLIGLGVAGLFRFVLKIERTLARLDVQLARLEGGQLDHEKRLRHLEGTSRKGARALVLLLAVMLPLALTGCATTDQMGLTEEIRTPIYDLETGEPVTDPQTGEQLVEVRRDWTPSVRQFADVTDGTTGPFGPIIGGVLALGSLVMGFKARREMVKRRQVEGEAERQVCDANDQLCKLKQEADRFRQAVAERAPRAAELAAERVKNSGA